MEEITQYCAHTHFPLSARIPFCQSWQRFVRSGYRHPDKSQDAVKWYQEGRGIPLPLRARIHFFPQPEHHPDKDPADIAKTGRWLQLQSQYRKLNCHVSTKL